MPNFPFPWKKTKKTRPDTRPPVLYLLQNAPPPPPHFTLTQTDKGLDAARKRSGRVLAVIFFPPFFLGWVGVVIKTRIIPTHSYRACKQLSAQCGKKKTIHARRQVEWDRMCATRTARIVEVTELHTSKACWVFFYCSQM